MKKKKLDIYNDNTSQSQQLQQKQLLSDKKNNNEIKPKTKKIIDNNTIPKKKGLRPVENSITTTIDRKNSKVVPTNNSNVKDKKIRNNSNYDKYYI